MPLIQARQGTAYDRSISATVSRPSLAPRIIMEFLQCTRLAELQGEREHPPHQRAQPQPTGLDLRTA